MYNSRTQTSTDTKTQLRYVSAKLRADLTLMREFYKEPTTQAVEDFVTEYEVLAEGGYLERVQFGFKRSDRIVFAIEYAARSGGGNDDRPGRIPATINISGASWFSFLTYSGKYLSLPTAQKAAIDAKIPVKRGFAQAPSAAGVTAGNTKQYSTQDFGLTRKVLH